MPVDREIYYNVRKRVYEVCEPTSEGGELIMETRSEERAYVEAGLMDDYLVLLRSRLPRRWCRRWWWVASLTG